MDESKEAPEGMKTEDLVDETEHKTLLNRGRSNAEWALTGKTTTKCNHYNTALTDALTTIRRIINNEV